MSDHPVIFSQPMVRALLDGRKTMTRRLAWLPPRDVTTGKIADSYQRPSPWQKIEAGDRLWVRENVSRFDKGTCDQHIWYWAGNNRPDYTALSKTLDGKWPSEIEGPGTGKPYSVPCIHLPRWASRLTLTVKTVRLERLQSISPQDAWDEGVDRQSRKVRQMWLYGADAEGREAIYKRACVSEFEDLWVSLHGAESWAANPEVVALTFSVIKANIDDAEAAAA